MAKSVVIPHQLSEEFEIEKNIAIKRSFKDDAPILLKAPESNSVYEFKNRAYIGTIDFHFEKTSSTLHYKFSPFAEEGKKFIITKDWRD
ncbi:hypothetical protein [Pseudomonas prosekii]|uniref:hypothetical protein n=1 Tax=Pseudomonas prosekii TaxID=1148509 RepID=UPI003F74CD42